MPLLEGVGDVLEKDQPQHDGLVLGRIHVVAELVGREAELGLKPEIRGSVHRFRILGHQSFVSDVARIDVESQSGRRVTHEEPLATALSNECARLKSLALRMDFRTLIGSSSADADANRKSSTNSETCSTLVTR